MLGTFARRYTERARVGSTCFTRSPSSSLHSSCREKKWINSKITKKNNRRTEVSETNPKQKMCASQEICSCFTDFKAINRKMVIEIFITEACTHMYTVNLISFAGCDLHSKSAIYFLKILPHWVPFHINHCFKTCKTSVAPFLFYFIFRVTISWSLYSTHWLPHAICYVMVRFKFQSQLTEIPTLYPSSHFSTVSLQRKIGKKEFLVLLFSKTLKIELEKVGHNCISVWSFFHLTCSCSLKQ